MQTINEEEEEEVEGKKKARKGIVFEQNVSDCVQCNQLSYSTHRSYFNHNICSWLISWCYKIILILTGFHSKAAFHIILTTNYSV